LRGPKQRKFVVIGLPCFALIAIVYATFFWADKGPSLDNLVLYEATRADLPITVTERGYLESQEQTTIECKVQTYDRNSGSSGITIIYIVPNGSVVEKEQLLVQLDSSAIEERLESETLEFQSDKSTLLQAEARKKNQITQNETSIAEAKLALELAKLDRQMYVDEQSGAFKLSVEEIERQIDDTRNSILEAQAALKLQETEKAGIEELFRLGYKGQSDLDQSRFAFMKSEAALAAAVNRLSNNEASRRQLKTYQYQKELLRLDGAVATAERQLKQVQVTNESELAQVDAQVFESQERVNRQKSRIMQLQRQLDNCKIYAPHSGMVVYAQAEDSNSLIAEGSVVRQRQELLTLPDLSNMQVRTQIHEAVLDQVRTGQNVSIRIDAFPNRVYQGVVSEVAVVPSRNSSTNAKTYDCVVQIPEEVQQLKPGMTAVSEIQIDRLEDVVSVPVQAILQEEEEMCCFVESNGRIERRVVELGRNNDKFVHLVSGIESGTRVVLNPKSVVGQDKKTEIKIAPDTGPAESAPIESAPAEALTKNKDSSGSDAKKQALNSSDSESEPIATAKP
jgi:HlyD family secretion protein